MEAKSKDVRREANRKVQEVWEVGEGAGRGAGEGSVTRGNEE